MPPPIANLAAAVQCVSYEEITPECPKCSFRIRIETKKRWNAYTLICLCFGEMASLLNGTTEKSLEAETLTWKFEKIFVRANIFWLS